MEKIIKSFLIFLTMALFSGCSRLMLEQRAFIRAVFIGQSESGFSAALWQEEENTLIIGEGRSLREAIYEAEGQLDGEPFYGQTRRVVLDSSLDWNQLTECSEVLTGGESKMPNVALWFAAELPKEDCASFLEQLEGLENNYSLTANLYELTRREEAIILPCYVEGELSALGRMRDKTLQWENQYAFLTLLMAGEAASGTVALDIPSGKLLVEGDFYTALESRKDGILIRLGIRNGSQSLLDRSEAPPKEAAEAALTGELNRWTQDIQREGVEKIFFSDRSAYHAQAYSTENNVKTISCKIELRD